MDDQLRHREHPSKSAHLSGLVHAGHGPDYLEILLRWLIRTVDAPGERVVIFVRTTIEIVSSGVDVGMSVEITAAKLLQAWH